MILNVVTIVDLLGANYTDFGDLTATSEFIFYNKDDYYGALDDGDSDVSIL